MNYSKNGLHLTEQFEGCKLTAYPDPGTGWALLHQPLKKYAN